MYDKYVKRIFDIIIVIVLFLPFFIILSIISVVIKIDSKGPVFFKQERLGRNGKVFKVYKFRTMIDDAESIGTGLSTYEGDPRVTRIGNILRKTSLDEIAQLINVLRGEMSLIGPRPPVPYHPRKYQEYDEKQRIRFSVRPGISGYAQIKGRNSLTWDERIIFDVQYVKKQNIILDMKIVLLTFVKIFQREDVHGPSRRNGRKDNLTEKKKEM